MHPKRLPDRLAQFLPRGGIAALTEGIEFISLWRWARLSLLVGAVVGLAAAGVYAVLEWGEKELLHRLTGAFDEGGVWWALLLVPAGGGLIAGLITWKFAPETAGAGTGQVIDAFHNQRGRIRRRVPVVKLVATLFTLGSGGSAGREGPMAQIGAGFGSFVATTLNLGARERRLLLLAGAAGGISALLRAPLGAALWALEVLYHDDIESEGMFPCLVSSVTAYSVFTVIYEQGSLFHVPVDYAFHPSQLGFYAVLGVACAVLGAVWVKWSHGTSEFFKSLRALPPWAKPALGGLLLGALAIPVPWVFATGFGWIQDVLRPLDDPARQLPIGWKGAGVLLGIAMAKMLATSFTVSSGGSGGKFAPGLFMGGMIGGACGLAFHELAPGIVTQPGAFVFVGMAAFYAGITKVPLSTIILVSELFGSYDLLVPIMFTEMISLLLLRRVAMYPEQVQSRRESPVHTATFTVDVLQNLRVADCFTRGRAAETVPTTMSLAAFLHHVSTTADSFFVVRGKDADLVGIVSLSNVRHVVADQDFLDHMLVSDAMWPFKSLAPDTDLRDALRVFLDSGYDHLPVVDPARPREVLGMLSQQQIFAAYNAEILRRRLSTASESVIDMPRAATDDDTSAGRDGRDER